MSKCQVSCDKFSSNDLNLFVDSIEQLSRVETLKHKRNHKTGALHIEENISNWNPEGELPSTNCTLATIHEAKIEMQVENIQEENVDVDFNSTYIIDKSCCAANSLYGYESANGVNNDDYAEQTFTLKPIGNDISDSKRFDFVANADPTLEFDAVKCFRSISGLNAIEYADVLSCHSNVSYSLPFDNIAAISLESNESMDTTLECDDSHIYEEPYETLIKRGKRKLSKLKSNIFGLMRKKCKKCFLNKTYSWEVINELN